MSKSKGKQEAEDPATPLSPVAKRQKTDEKYIRIPGPQGLQLYREEQVEEQKD